MPDPVPASSLSDRPSPAPGDGYKALFENMDEGFCVVEMIYDPSGHPTDYRFVEINPAFEANTGLHEALGRTGPRPNFLDHQEGVIDGRHSHNRPGHAGGEPLRSSRRTGATYPMLLLRTPAARVGNA